MPSFAVLFGVVTILQACSGPSPLVRHVPEDGYKRTLNYQFQAMVRADSRGECQMMVVRVKPLNKMYSGNEPPSRLRLFDDDCSSPLRFERVEYRAKDGNQIRLSGTDVARFMSEFTHLEGEVVDWLWREGEI